MIHFFISFFHFFSSHKDPLMDDVWVTSVIMHTHFAANCLLCLLLMITFSKEMISRGLLFEAIFVYREKRKSLGLYKNSSQDFCMRCDWLMSHLRPKVGIVDKRSSKCCSSQSLLPPLKPRKLEESFIEMQSIEPRLVDILGKGSQNQARVTP